MSAQSGSPGNTASPYAPPQASLDTPEALARSSARVRAWGVSTSLILTMVAAIAYAATVAFEQMYSSFGADLPWLTLGFLKGRLAWFALPALALALTVAAWRQKPLTVAYSRRAVLRFLLLIGAAAVVGSVAVVALYLPIFRLGQAV